MNPPTHTYYNAQTMTRCNGANELNLMKNTHTHTDTSA